MDFKTYFVDGISLKTLEKISSLIKTNLYPFSFSLLGGDTV